MGIKYLWDTNTAIYYLQQQFPPAAEQFMDSLLKEGQPTISAITETELLCWKAATEKDLEVLRNFINDALVIELEQAIKLKTADKIADALNVTIDYLIKDAQYQNIDNEALKRFSLLEKLSGEDKAHIFALADAFFPKNKLQTQLH